MTTPELPSLPPNYHPIPSEGYGASTNLTCISAPYTAGLKRDQDSNPQHTSYEFMIVNRDDDILPEKD
ncbi:hypothetical protein TNCV_4792021 [Trichonephila clavipes]|nr:hypothetical protein TNCV_4792021 [Trichonephila clavipes]